jgi:phosphonate transport system permease protein
MSVETSGLGSSLLGRRRPGARTGVLIAILVVGLAAATSLRLDPADLIPSRAGLALAGEFLARALTPALSYEASDLPAGTRPLLLKAVEAAYTTVIFAAASTSLAMILGVPLGFLASSGFWRRTGAESTTGRRTLRAAAGRFAHLATRALIACLRSVHELLWAVLLLAALGFTPMAAVVAMALPAAGTLAKVFSEILDEAPLAAAGAQRAAGAGHLQSFCFALVPAALPDLAAYAFYRFECAVRISAVIGFFGFPTLGYYLAASFENLYYGEVWTYLYTLFLLVLALDWWSGRLRQRMNA